MMHHWKVTAYYDLDHSNYEVTVWINDKSTSEGLEWRGVAWLQVPSLDGHFSTEQRIRQILRTLGVNPGTPMAYAAEMPGQLSLFPPSR